VEAPAVAQLAQQNPELNIIGMGAQDSLDLANQFVSSTPAGEADITMIWDTGFDTWREFGIRSQPYWILFDAQGNEIESRPGIIDEALIESALS